MTASDLGRFAGTVWRVLRVPMVAAVVMAGGLSAILAVVVLGPLSESAEEERTPAALAAAVAEATATATVGPPPTVAVEVAATGVAPTAAVAPPPAATVAPPTATVPPPTATATPPPTAPPAPPPTPAPTPTPTTQALYVADAADGLEDWELQESWALGGGSLANDGSAVVAQPWLVAPFAPTQGDYAVEAEIRYVGLAPSTCDQNFGVVAGGGGVIVGGGVKWGCNEEGSQARITDVSYWQDGYNLDAAFATAAFTPGSGWQTYRLEVREGEVRLLIDGEVVVEATDPGLGSAGEGQVGVWSQGVRIEVRRVAVLPA